MSIMVICEHVESGNRREFDILENFEFKHRYGHRNPNHYPELARGLLREWNLQGRRTGHKYIIKPFSITV